MNVTATTRLTAEQCMERLAACPALPRGERTSWAYRAEPKDRPEGVWHDSSVKWLRHGNRSALEGASEIWTGLYRSHNATAWMRRLAAPVRRLREERRALRKELAWVGHWLVDMGHSVRQSPLLHQRKP